jgi:hypothetical protein
MQAYYNRSLAKLLLHEGNYLEEALHDLSKTREIIEETLLPRLQVMQLMYSNTHHQASQEAHLGHQVQFKVNVLRLQLHHIEGAISAINQVLAHPEGGRVNVTKESPLTSFFDDPDQYRQEIAEFHHQGLVRLYQVEHQLFNEDIDVFGMFGSAILGGMQALLGICSTMAGHPLMGALLIEEGISDLVFTAECMLGLASFSWRGYKTHKTASAAWNATMLGISAIKSRLSQSSLHKALSSPLQGAAERKAMKEIIQKKVIQSLATSSARALVHFGLSHHQKSSYLTFVPRWQDRLRRVLREYFHRPETIHLLNTLCSQDPYMQQKLIDVASLLIHPRTNQLASIGRIYM